jgi:hypothetical protein
MCRICRFRDLAGLSRGSVPASILSRTISTSEVVTTTSVERFSTRPHHQSLDVHVASTLKAEVVGAVNIAKSASEDNPLPAPEVIHISTCINR